MTDKGTNTMTTNNPEEKKEKEGQPEEEASEGHSLLDADKAAKDDAKTTILEQQNVEETDKTTEVVIEQETAVNHALDGGYGWFVVLASVVTHMLIGGLERASGVLFLIFQERYQESAAATAWVLSLASAIRLMAGPLSSALCQKYSHRAVVIIGALVSSLGVLISGFAPNLAFLFFSYGVVRGIGTALAYAPAVIIVGIYFNKRRGMAVGIATAGVGVGTFAVPPFIEVVFGYYGFLGSFLILTGYMLNIMVCGSLFRPLKLERRYLAFQKKKKLNMLNGSDAERCLKNGTVTEMDQDSDKMDSPKAVQNMETANGMKRKQSKVSLLGYVLSRRKSSVAKVKQKEIKKKGKILEIKLLKDFRFCAFCIAMFLFTIAFQAAFVFLPSYGKQIGLSDIEAAYLLSIAGVLDTIGRVGAGTILDLKRVKPYRMIVYNSNMFFLVLTCALIPATKTFLQLAIIAAAYGMLTGTYISQKSVIIVDLLGPEKLNNSFGLMICFQGLGMLVGPPFAGLLKDSFGRVDEAFYFGGASILLGAILLTSSNIMHYLRGKRQSND